jgi:hypothetical protein
MNKKENNDCNKVKEILLEFWIQKYIIIIIILIRPKWIPQDIALTFIY